MRFINQQVAVTAVLACSILLYSCTQKIYVVRHAEKQISAGEMMNQDPPLTAAGKDRAIALRDRLRHKNINTIFSTNTVRTISTAQPLIEITRHKEVILYSSKPDSLDAFISRIRQIRKGNILVVGHSNTVDDISNKLCGLPVLAGDLLDNEYDNLFIIKRKGNHYFFNREKYGSRLNN